MLDLCINVTCVALGSCYEAGVCNKNTGNCTNPEKPNGSSCNDNNPTTINDEVGGARLWRDVE
jgi:hypothetical protein